MDIGGLLKEKREDILRIAAEHGARNVRVFGSVARGEAGPESDIDLIVQFDPGVTLLGHSALARELEALLGRKVQVVSERGLRPRVKERVMREAAPI
jgi:hypothetical protein